MLCYYHHPILLFVKLGPQLLLLLFFFQIPTDVSSFSNNRSFLQKVHRGTHNGFIRPSNHLVVKRSWSSSRRRGPIGSQSAGENYIEPYVGPIGSMADMEGGIAITENALSVLVGSSLVAPGRGLFLAIFDERGGDDENIEELNGIGGCNGEIEEVVIPQGTPICGYARGYFSSEEKGDKSVSFMFTADSPIFYEKQLMGISDAIQLVLERGHGASNSKSDQEKSTSQILWGHNVEFDSKTGAMSSISPDKDFDSRIFIPDDEEENEHQFSAMSLGIYINDLAYEPNSSEEKYLEKSNENNILQLIWRLVLDVETNMLVPSWPVVVAKKDFRLCNTVPMEVGLGYGFKYWNAVQGLQ